MINVTPPSSPPAPIPAATNTQLDVELYVAKDITGASPGAGLPAEYAVGDLLQREVTFTNGTIDSTVWTNLTSNTVLTVVPPGVDLVQKETTGLTDAELRAAPVEVIVTNQVTTQPATSFETVVTTYTVKSALPGADYVVDDIVQSVELVDKSVSPPTVLSLEWKNITQGTTGITVNTNDLVLTPTSALTDTELRASPIEVYNKDTETELYTTSASTAEYNEGDILRRVTTYNSADGTETVVWENVNLGTTLTTNPVPADLTIASGKKSGFDTETQFFIATADNSTVGYVAGDELHRIVTFDNSASPTVVASEYWKNITTGASLTGIPTPGEYRVYSGTPESVENAANLLRTTQAGVVAGGAYEVAIANIGGADAIIQGTLIPAGYSIEFTADAGDYLEQIVYDCSGTECIIQSTYATTPLPVVAMIFKPAIYNIANGAIDVPVTGPFLSTAYNATGAAGTHATSEWEIYDDVALTNLVASVNDPTMLTNMTVTAPGLALNTTYYVRVRYTSSGGLTSDWSDVVDFTTSSTVPLIVGVTMTAGGTQSIVVNNTNSPATINWGDGVVEDWEKGLTATHTYATAGSYDITVTGHRALQFQGNNNKELKQWGSASYTDVSTMFDACELAMSATDSPDFSALTSCSNMFRYCRMSGDVSSLSPALTGATNLQNMFGYSMVLPTGLQNWDTSSVTNMQAMFATCQSGVESSASTFDQIAGWNTSAVTTMNSMFSNAAGFNTDISAWDVSSVTDTQMMFMDSAFNYDISGWDVSSVTTMFAMFANTPFDQPLYGWTPTSCTDAQYMMYQTNYTHDLSHVYFTALDLFGTGWNTSIDRHWDYFGLNQAVDNGFYDNRDIVPTGVGTNGGMVVTIYKNNAKFTGITSDGTGRIDWGDGTITAIPAGSNATYTHTYSDGGVNTVEIYGGITSIAFAHDDGYYATCSLRNFHRFGNLTFDNMDYMFWRMTGEQRFSGSLDLGYKFNPEDVPTINPGATMIGTFGRISRSVQGLDLSQWDVSAVTSMNSLFYGTSVVDNYALDITGWDVSSVTDMHRMFSGMECENSSLTYTTFDSSACTDMSEMFASLRLHSYNDLTHVSPAAAGISSLIAGLNTSNVTTIKSFLSSSYGMSLNLNFAGWNTSNVTDMSSAFNNGYLSDLSSISGWDVSSVTDMNNMFGNNNGTSLSNLNLSAWDVSSVQDMSWFMSSSSYNLNDINVDLSNFNLASLINMSYAFEGTYSNNSNVRNYTGFDTWTLPTAAGTVNGTSVFDGARGWTTSPTLANWNGECFINLRSMFNDSDFAPNLNSWVMAAGAEMRTMFASSGNASANPTMVTTDVSAVTMMDSMFQNNTVFNGDISGWDVSSLTDADYMFYGSVFNTDISNWCVSSLPNGPYQIFTNSSYSHLEPKYGFCGNGWYPATAGRLSFIIGVDVGYEGVGYIMRQFSLNGSGGQIYYDGITGPRLTSSSSSSGAFSTLNDRRIEVVFDNPSVPCGITIISSTPGLIVKEVIKGGPETVSNITVAGVNYA